MHDCAIHSEAPVLYSSRMYDCGGSRLVGRQCSNTAPPHTLVTSSALPQSASATSCESFRMIRDGHFQKSTGSAGQDRRVGDGRSAWISRSQRLQAAGGSRATSAATSHLHRPRLASPSVDAPPNSMHRARSSPHDGAGRVTSLSPDTR